MRLSKPSQRVTRLGGVLARRRPPSASPSNRRMPEPNIGDRNSYGSYVHEFRTAKLRRGSRTLAHDQVRRGWSKIITIFQWVLIFEQSVNRRRGPRWWPQIGAAATRLKVAQYLDFQKPPDEQDEAEYPTARAIGD